jgi:UDP-2,3-diacylglucosamine hydrolase
MQETEHRTKIYFISDSHLGVPDYAGSLNREKLLVRWLDEVRSDASEIYLLGDIFDFWFEYATVVPKGFVRLLGKLADLSDSGIKIHYFTGNHDMWMFDYFPKELGIDLYRAPVSREIGGKRFMIGHGDGLGPSDHGYKFIKKVFASRLCQWLFARIHPNLGVRIALYFSRKSRIACGDTDEVFKGADKEYLLLHINELLQKEHFDYIIYGHRHLPFDLKLKENSRYINLGDWVTHFTYAVFDGTDLEFKSYLPNEGDRIIREIE